MKNAKFVVSLILAVCVAACVNAYARFGANAAPFKPKYDAGMEKNYVRPFYRYGEIYEAIFLDDWND
jgi:hypothetical protein